MSIKTWKIDTDRGITAELTSDENIGRNVRVRIESANTGYRILTDLTPDDALALAEMLVAAAKEARKITEV